MDRDIDVLVVGDANPDLILRGDVVPRFGQSEQLLDSADVTVGGSGAIVAHGLARLGLRTALVAVIGADTFGELTREQLKGAGIDTAELRTDPDLPTGLSVILTQGDTRTTLTLVGAIAALDPAGIDSDLLRRARHVHASSFFLQPRLAAGSGLAELFRRAHEVGTTTSLDTNLDPADRWDGLGDVLPVTDVLLPNRTEILGMAARYGGAHRTLDGDDVVAAARVIAHLGPLVVVKDGERGAIAVSPELVSPELVSPELVSPEVVSPELVSPEVVGPEVGTMVGPGSGSGTLVGAGTGTGSVLREPGHPVVAVDSTGAGDSFDAAFLAARVRGLPLPICLTIACRAGALSTLGVGGTSAQASAAQLRLGDQVSPMNAFTRDNGQNWPGPQP